MKRFYVHLVIGAAAAALLLPASGCHKEPENASPYATPEDTILAYAAAMKAGDFEGALDCYAKTALSPASIGVEGLTEPEMKNLFLKSLADNQAPYAEADPRDVKVKMLTAEVTYDLGGGKHTQTLVNEDGEWKIATDITNK